jgi:hypothetical protein
MAGKLGRGVGYLLIGGYLLLLSAILVLALHQAMGLVGLHSGWAALPLARSLSSQWWAGIGAGGYALGMVGIATILFILVLRRPRRLLLVTLVIILAVAGLDLYSARHVLPQVLIWPSPLSLSDQYLQALADEDPEAALRLTDRSDACTAIMTQVFQEDHNLLEERLGTGWQDNGLPKASVRSIATYFAPWPPEEVTVLQPVPQQLARIMVRTEDDKTAWLSLRMSHGPFLGRRYICGAGMDS